jgi:hypothetical protein
LRDNMPVVRFLSASACALFGSALSIRSSSSFKLSPGGEVMRPPSAVRLAHSSMRSISAADM